MSALAKEDLPAYSYEDYQHWEGDWELIEGIPYAMSPAPVKRHQILALSIGSELLERSDKCPYCEVLLDADWKLDSNTLLKPDVSLVCHDDNPKFISKTPDIIFEILSPSTARRDEGIKFDHYEEQGVKYYILVYPDELIAKIYQYNGDKFKKVAECDTEDFYFEEVSCPFKFSFKEIFKRLRR
jgi:Uma2 family endonuclease